MVRFRWHVQFHFMGHLFISENKDELQLFQYNGTLQEDSDIHIYESNLKNKEPQTQHDLQL